MVLINCEAYGHSELAWQIYGEKFLQRILTNARTFVNVVQHLRDFGRFEMNKRDLKEKIAFSSKTKFSTKLKTNHEQYVVRVLQITWEFLIL
jgi:hypothetical protein